MSVEDDFTAAFRKLEAAVDAFSAHLESSPLALSPLHLERFDGQSYTLLTQPYFEALEAKAAAWDEAHRDAVAEAEEELQMLIAADRGALH